MGKKERLPTLPVVIRGKIYKPKGYVAMNQLLFKKQQSKIFGCRASS